jgi:hypothetical protein
MGRVGRELVKTKFSYGSLEELAVGTSRLETSGKSHRGNLTGLCTNHF